MPDAGRKNLIESRTFGMSARRRIPREEIIARQEEAEDEEEGQRKRSAQKRLPSQKFEPKMEKGSRLLRRRSTGPQAIELVAARHGHVAGLVELVEVLEDPAAGVLHEALATIELGVALGPEAAEVAELGLLVELVQLARGPVDDVGRVDVVVDVEPGRLAVQRVRRYGRVEPERRARRPARQSVAGEERREKRQHEEDEQRQEVRQCRQERRRGLVHVFARRRVAWSSPWTRARELVNSETRASAEVEDELGAGVEHASVCANQAKVSRG